ncbi:hypothetical protein WIX39_022650 [Variovorax sp. AB1(2024)]|uniref:hypothetical protein n=1 Tax=Variovorax sp. AB1(2024) TaxID=3132214 RepID=UPI00309DC462
MIDVFTDEWVLIDGVLYKNPHPKKGEPPPAPLDFDHDCPHWRSLDDSEREEELHHIEGERGLNI